MDKFIQDYIGDGAPQQATVVIAQEIEREAVKQITKWGVRFHHSDRWTVICAEELGEVARASLTGNSPALRHELVQLAAAALCAIFEMDVEAGNGR